MQKPKVGKNCSIERGVIIGYGDLTKLRKGFSKDTQVIIGDNVKIRVHSLIYNGCKLDSNSHIGHNTILREFTEVGEHSSIGSLVMCEGYTKIGHHTIVHSQTHLTAKMEIGNYVFIGPSVVTANDHKLRYFRPMNTEEDKGPIIEDGAIIGAGAKILPWVKVGKGAFVAMGAVVTKDVEPFSLVMGIPAKHIRIVRLEEVAEPLIPVYLKMFPEMRQIYITPTRKLKVKKK